jgi:hypothetical protein
MGRLLLQAKGRIATPKRFVVGQYPAALTQGGTRHINKDRRRRPFSQTALLMAWMSSPSVIASTIITLAHCDAVRRGQRPVPHRETRRLERDAGAAGHAERKRIAPSYITGVLRLTRLAPDIVEAILDGRQGSDVTLARVLEPLPVE